MISFKYRHFQKDIILMAVRWYVAYSLSYRDIEELMSERGVTVDHSTINRWVVKYSPELELEFRKNYKHTVGRSWRMDETYIKVKGKWVYLYRAVDKEGNTIDFMLSTKRDKASARSFFDKAIVSHDVPAKVTIDKSGSNKSALDSINLQFTNSELQKQATLPILIRQIKYLNNIVEQDHRHIKRITKPMLGFKVFSAAQATIAGIELHHMLRKGQHVNAANQDVFEQFYALAE